MCRRRGTLQIQILKRALFEESGANAKSLDISGGSEEVGEQLAPKETMSRVSKKAKKKQPRQQSSIEGPPFLFAEIFGL